MGGGGGGKSGIARRRSIPGSSWGPEDRKGGGRGADSRSPSPRGRSCSRAGSLPRGRRGQLLPRQGSHRGALPRRRPPPGMDGPSMDPADNEGWRGSSDRKERIHRTIQGPQGLTLTPAVGSRTRGRGLPGDDEFGPIRRRPYDDGRRGSDRMKVQEYGSFARDQEDPAAQKRYLLRLEDWFLAVHLLLQWDDQKTISAAEMEEFLSQFLENDAKSKHRITPRLASEIFLRGILRTLWDVDRLLRAVNPTDELKMVTAKSPLVLSILRVMAYQFMWTPKGTVKSAREGAQDLMDKCDVFQKDQDWIIEAMIRMGKAFHKVHASWDEKQEAVKEKKRRERAAQAAAAAAEAANAEDAAAGANASTATGSSQPADAKRRKRQAEGLATDVEGKDRWQKVQPTHRFGNARALAATQARGVHAAPTRKTAAVVRPAAAQDEEEEGEEGDEHKDGAEKKVRAETADGDEPNEGTAEELDDDGDQEGGDDKDQDEQEEADAVDAGNEDDDEEDEGNDSGPEKAVQENNDMHQTDQEDEAEQVDESQQGEAADDLQDSKELEDEERDDRADEKENRSEVVDELVDKNNDGKEDMEDEASIHDDTLEPSNT